MSKTALVLILVVLAIVIGFALWMQNQPVNTIP